MQQKKHPVKRHAPGCRQRAIGRSSVFFRCFLRRSQRKRHFLGNSAGKDKSYSRFEDGTGKRKLIASRYRFCEVQGSKSEQRMPCFSFASAKTRSIVSFCTPF